MARKRPIPLMPFDTLAWLSMPGVRRLSPELRSLWLDLLCLMCGSVERGVLLKPNGDLYTRGEINCLLAINDDGMIQTLIDAGLCAWREDGALFSREIIRGEEIRAKRREAGLKGGNATKAKIFSPPPEPEPEPPQEVKIVEPVLPLIEDQSQEELPPPPPLSTEEKAKIKKKKKYKYAEFVSLTREEYAKLCEAHGEDGAKRMIEILDNYKGSSGKRYKDDYRAILNWVVDRYNEELKKNGIYQRQSIHAPNPGGGYAYNSGCSNGTLPTDQAAGGGSTDEAPKDYSERF